MESSILYKYGPGESALRLVQYNFPKVHKKWYCTIPRPIFVLFYDYQHFITGLMIYIKPH